MKRMLALLIVLLIFSGCAGENELSQAMALRQKILTEKGYAFDAVITADYGEKLYTFGVACQSDATGTLQFNVISPETIAGITGTLSPKGGQLTFDDKMLAFELLVEEQLSPISMPWVVMHSVGSGFIRSSGNDGEDLYIQIDDSYAGESLQIDLWCDKTVLPKYAEILYRGKRILSMKIENFRFL